MTTITIEESGMSFGPFAADKCFEVERSAAYRSIEADVKVAEFVWLRDDLTPPKLWVVEAKSSTPQPHPPERFAEFVDEIKEKLVNAVTMVVAACLNRANSGHRELSSAFRSLPLDTVDARLILVVNGHSKSWLPPLQEALQRALRPTVKTWGFNASAVIVINHDMARARRLIS